MRQTTGSGSVSNRLVFVSIKGKSAKRKVAVPITPSTTWPEFVETVRRKLKLQGPRGGGGDIGGDIGGTGGSLHDGLEMELVGGEALRGLDQLEDIAEVLVVVPDDHHQQHEGRGGVLGGDMVTRGGTGGNGGVYRGNLDGAGASTSATTFATAQQPVASPFSSSVSRSLSPRDATNLSNSSTREQGSSKYIKKQSDVALALGRIQSIFGGASQESLPLTKKDTMHLTPIEQVKRRMKKRRRSVFDPRVLLALFSLLSVGVMLVFVYIRVTGSSMSGWASATSMDGMASNVGRKTIAGNTR